MRLLLCAALFLAVPHLALPAPIPRERQDSGLYHPTRQGDKWVYEHDNGETAFVITDVEEKDGTKIVAVGSDDWKPPLPVMRVSVSEKALYQLPIKGADLPATVCLLKLPAKVGDKWEFKTSGPDGKMEGSVTVAAIEKVEVPAGTFTAIRVELSYSGDGKPRRITHWYAREVGLIKSTDGKTTCRLKSFTKG